MYRKILSVVFIAALLILAGCGRKRITYPGFVPSEYQDRLGKVVYANNFDGHSPLAGMVMEGAGRAVVTDGWMVMDSPDMAGHLVHWIDTPMPANFMMRFDFKVQSEDGLCILFICASGKDGESIFDPALPKRAGNFVEYTEGGINNYLLQYYTQNPTHLDDTNSELRKNAGFELIEKVPAVIKRGSTKKYRITVIKDGGRILMLANDKVIVDGTDRTSPLGSGFIGLRQMKWTKAAYDNIVVRELN